MAQMKQCERERCMRVRWPGTLKWAKGKDHQPRRLRLGHGILHPGPLATELSRLEHLPQDLILEVLDHLPLESQACLAHCSRMMVRKVGTRPWLSLRSTSNAESQQRYLGLMQRDRLVLTYCAKCFECCHRKCAPLQRQQRSYGRVIGDYVDLGRLGDGWPFVSHCHHLFHRGIAVDTSRRDSSVLFRQTLDRTGGLLPCATAVFQVEARCTDGQVYVRTQRLIQLNMRSASSVRRGVRAYSAAMCDHVRWEGFGSLRLHSYRPPSRRAWHRMQERALSMPGPAWSAAALAVADHDSSDDDSRDDDSSEYSFSSASSGDDFSDDTTTPLLRSQSPSTPFATSHARPCTHPSSQRCKHCSIVERCAYCPTSATLQVLSLGRPGRLGLLVTQWKHLGPQRTPTDLAWRAQAWSLSGPRWRARVDAAVAAATAAGQIHPAPTRLWQRAQRADPSPCPRDIFEALHGAASFEHVSAQTIAIAQRASNASQPIVPLPVWPRTVEG